MGPVASPGNDEKLGAPWQAGQALPANEHAGGVRSQALFGGVMTEASADAREEGSQTCNVWASTPIPNAP